VFDEGVERCLDNLKSTAGVNNVMVFTHTYVAAGKNRQPEALASDHGIEQPDPRYRDLTSVWINHDPAYFRGQRLLPVRSPDQEYGDRDVLDELEKPARDRGIAVYARLLEGGKNLPLEVPGAIGAMTVDLRGLAGRHPCWNSPDYRLFIQSILEETFANHPVSGINYGSERYGPLSDLLLWGRTPECFCPHCLKRADERGIDGRRARAGYQELQTLLWKLRSGASLRDGAYIVFLSTLLRYPEILSWEQLAHEWREEFNRLLYGTVKRIDPQAEFGVHVDHQKTTWDPLSRAEIDYAEMTEYNDFIKPVVYHDVAGPRIRHYSVDPLHQTVFRQMTVEQQLEWHYRVMGFDSEHEPSYEELADTGLSAEYVRREVSRCVENVGGGAEVYPGIGLDIPFAAKPQAAAWEPFLSDPDELRSALAACFEAGAGGVVLCREYDEIRLSSLRAAGHALRELGKID
jgi:hypothetical protein